MSTWSDETFACPRCAAPVTIRIALGVHASRVPHVRDDILAGRLHRAACACGAAVDVHRAFVYTDVHRGQWIHVARPMDLGGWATIERDALATFDRALRTSAVAERLDASFVRVVFDVDELRERLVIRDAGLDDAIVECVKLRCVRERPGLRGPGERIRLRGFADGGLVLARIRATDPRPDLATWTVPRAVVIECATWRERFPELHGPGFISIDRYLEGAP